MLTDSDSLIAFLVRQITQVGFVLEYMDDIVTDFLFLAGIDIDPFNDDFGGMDSRKFFSHARRIPTFDGSVKRRMLFELQKVEQDRADLLAEKESLVNGPGGLPNWGAIAKKARDKGSITDEPIS